MVEPATYRLDLPWQRPPLTHNQRLHWHAKAEIVAAVRKAAWLLARQAKIPYSRHIVVQLHYAPGDRRRRDSPNLTATSKPAIDGIVDAGVVPDDSDQYVTELMPRIEPLPEPGPRCWLTVTIASPGHGTVWAA